MNKTYKAKVNKTVGFFEKNEILTLEYYGTDQNETPIYKTIEPSKNEVAGYNIEITYLDVISETRSYYRVKTPSHFSDLDTPTIEEAVKMMDEFGDISEKSEHYDYWQEQKEKCYIVTVAETEEVLSNEDINKVAQISVDYQEAFEGEQIAKQADGKLY